MTGVQTCALPILNFLADTGASLSIFPHKSNKATTGPKLVAIEGSQMKLWGFAKKSVKFGENVFEFKLILADVTTPILGPDFFAHFSLLVSL